MAHVFLHYTGEDGVIALAVGHMVLAAQRIGHGMDGAAAGGAESKTCKVGGGEEPVHQGLAAVGAVGRDMLIAVNDHLDGLIAE